MCMTYFSHGKHLVHKLLLMQLSGQHITPFFLLGLEGLFSLENYNLKLIFGSLRGPFTLTILIIVFLKVESQLSEKTQFFLGCEAL